jgi:hypothetical protein
MLLLPLGWWKGGEFGVFCKMWEPHGALLHNLGLHSDCWGSNQSYSHDDKPRHFAFVGESLEATNYIIMTFENIMYQTTFVKLREEQPKSMTLFKWFWCSINSLALQSRFGHNSYAWVSNKIWVFSLTEMILYNFIVCIGLHLHMHSWYPGS